jgi:TRAP-type C4-dicarboxylate transport system substrate-binding protein
VALQTGVMDAQENPLAQIYPARFQEVQKYLSMTGHVYTPAYVAAGASWGRFGPEVQKVLTDTAKEMQPVVYKIAAVAQSRIRCGWPMDRVLKQPVRIHDRIDN